MEVFIETTWFTYDKDYLYKKYVLLTYLFQEPLTRIFYSIMILLSSTCDDSECLIYIIIDVIITKWLKLKYEWMNPLLIGNIVCTYFSILINHQSSTELHTNRSGVWNARCVVPRKQRWSGVPIYPPTSSSAPRPTAERAASVASSQSSWRSGIHRSIGCIWMSVRQKELLVLDGMFLRHRRCIPIAASNPRWGGTDAKSVINPDQHQNRVLRILPDPLLGWWHQVNSVLTGVLALFCQVGEHALVAITPDTGTGRRDVGHYLVDLSRC